MMTMNKTYVARVSFPGTPGRRYDFITDVPGLQVRDKVVVESVQGLGVAIVVEVLATSPDAKSWVIQKIDLDAHNKKVQRYARLTSLEKRMLDHLKTHGMREQYEALAKTDEVMAHMLVQYDELQGGEEV